MFQPIFYIQLYEMKHEDYIDKINSLTTAINQFKESYSLLKFSLEASEKRNESLQFQVTRLQDIICIFTDEISGLRVEEFNRISYIECTRFDVVDYEDEYVEFRQVNSFGNYYLQSIDEIKNEENNAYVIRKEDLEKQIELDRAKSGMI